MSFTIDATQVTITLTGVKRGDTKPNFKERKFNLTPRSMSMPIGRSSKHHGQRGDPESDNAFFNSPVISRKHAELFLLHSTKYVHIRDLGSLHGTIVNNTNLASGEEMDLRNGDVITIGSDVAHKDKSYQAQTFQIIYERHPYVESPKFIPSDALEDGLHSPAVTDVSAHIGARATFSVPEFGSSDSDYYDSEQSEEDEHMEIKEELVWLQNDAHVQHSNTTVIPIPHASEAVGTSDPSLSTERPGSSHHDPLVINDDNIGSRPAFIDLTEDRRSRNESVAFNLKSVADSDSDSVSVNSAGENDCSSTAPSVTNVPLSGPVSKELLSAGVRTLIPSSLDSAESHLDAPSTQDVAAEQIMPAKPTLPSVRSALKDILELPEPVNVSCTNGTSVLNNNNLDKKPGNEGTSVIRYESEIPSEDESSHHPKKADSVVCAKFVDVPGEAIENLALQQKFLRQRQLILLEKQLKLQRLSMVEAEAKAWPQQPQGLQGLAKPELEALNGCRKCNTYEMNRLRALTTASDEIFSVESAAPLPNYGKVPTHTSISRENPTRSTEFKLPRLPPNSGIHLPQLRFGDIQAKRDSENFKMAPSTTKSVSFADKVIHVAPACKQPPLSFGRSLPTFTQSSSTHDSSQRHWNEGKPFAMYDKHFQTSTQISCPLLECQSTNYNGGQPTSSFCSPYASPLASSFSDFRKTVDLSPHEYHPYYPVHGISMQANTRCDRASAALPCSNITTENSEESAVKNYSMNHSSDMLHDKCREDPRPNLEVSRPKPSNAENIDLKHSLQTTFPIGLSPRPNIKPMAPTASSSQSTTSLNRFSIPSIVDQSDERASIAGTKRKAIQISNCNLKSLERMKTGDNIIADVARLPSELVEIRQPSENGTDAANIADHLTVEAARPIAKPAYSVAKMVLVAKTNQLNALSRKAIAIPTEKVSEDRQPARKRTKLTSRAAPFLVGALAGGVAVLGALITLPESLF